MLDRLNSRSAVSSRRALRPTSTTSGSSRDGTGQLDPYIFHRLCVSDRRLLAIIVGAAFDKAVRSYTEAFETRARAVYGRPASTVRI